MMPLTKRDEARAVKTAVTYLKERVDGGRDDRFRVLAVQLRVRKPDRPPAAPPRSIGVTVVDYTNRRNFDFLIDGKWTVVEVKELDYQPPFTDDEIKEAAALARRDPRIGRVARSRGTFVSEFGPDSPDGDNARLVGLRFVARKGKTFRFLARVVVNLSDRSVKTVEEAPAEGGK